MTSPVITVAARARYPSIVQLMVTSGVSGLPVIDAQSDLVGIITETDLVAAAVQPPCRPRALLLLADWEATMTVDKPRNLLAVEIMTSPVMTCRPDDGVEAVARRLCCQRLKRLPVLDGRKLVGIITRSDVLARFGRPDHDVAEEVEQALREIPGEREVQLSVREGLVTIAGEVSCHSRRALMIRRAGAVRGVRGVANLLSCPTDPFRAHAQSVSSVAEQS